jgi:hypothetical protein
MYSQQKITKEIVDVVAFMKTTLPFSLALPQNLRSASTE